MGGKSRYSKFAPTWYTLEKAISDIEENVLERGQNVIIDSAKMTSEHYKEAYKEIVSSVWMDKVGWDVKSKWNSI